MAAMTTTCGGGDSFRRYLEESGAVDVISTGPFVVERTSSVNAAKSVALASLYEEEERPDNAIDFLKAQLGAPTAQDYAKLEEEKRHLEQDLADARARIAVLETQVRSSRNKILNNKVLPTQLDQERECPSTLESPSDQPTP